VAASALLVFAVAGCSAQANSVGNGSVAAEGQCVDNEATWTLEPDQSLRLAIDDLSRGGTKGNDQSILANTGEGRLS